MESQTSICDFDVPNITAGHRNYTVILASPSSNIVMTIPSHPSPPTRACEQRANDAGKHGSKHGHQTTKNNNGAMARPPFYWILLLLSGCSAGSGAGLDANGRPIGESPEPGNEPTLANIQARVFTPICTQCHIGAAAPQGLRLDAANAFDSLVGVPSREAGNLLLVDPFNPGDSYLVQKIEGTAAVGAQMPLVGPPLSDEDMMLIRQWIIEGAMDTPPVASGPTQIQSINVTSAAIRIAFTGALDASTVHSGTVILTRSDGAPVGPYSVAVAAMNPRAIVVWLPNGKPNGAAYRLGLNADVTVSILDLNGFALQPYEMEFR